MYFLFRVNVVDSVVDSSWSFSEACRNQINFSVIVAAVTDSIDTCLAGFLFAVDDNLVTVEVEPPVFKVTDRRFETIVDKEVV